LNDRKYAIVIFILFFQIYVLTSGGHHYYDERIAFENARSIVENGRLDLPEELARKLPWGVVQAADGKYYSRYSIVWILTFVPFTTLAKLISSLTNLPLVWHQYDTYPLVWILYNPIFVAGIASVLFLFSRNLGFNPRLSLVLVLIFGLSTLAWPYSKTGLNIPLCTLSFLTSMYLIRLNREKTRLKLYLASGTLGSLSALVRFDFILFLPFLIAFALMVDRKSTFENRAKSLLGLAFPVLVFIITVGYYNYLRFGSFLETGYSYGYGLRDYGILSIHTTPLHVGICGLLLSTGVGLFIFVPVSIISIPSFLQLYKKDSSLAMISISIFLFTLFYYGSLGFWHGWPEWGPRYLFINIPLLLLALGAAFESWKSIVFKVTVTLLALAGSFVNIVAILYDWTLTFSNIYKEKVWSVVGQTTVPDWLLFDPPYSPIARQLPEVLGGKFDLFLLSHCGLIPMTILTITTFITGFILARDPWRIRWHIR